MTRKKKSILIFIFLLFFLGIFLNAKAALKIRSCCKLDNQITIKVKNKEITCQKGALLGPNLGSANVCVAPGHTISSTANNCFGGEVGTTDVFCANAGNTPPPNCPGTTSPGLWATFCLLDAIINATNLLFRILVIGSSVMIIAGSIFIIYSSGDTKKWSTGRNFILYSLIALIVGLFAKAIPSIASLLLGMKY